MKSENSDLNKKWPEKKKLPSDGDIPDWVPKYIDGANAMHDAFMKVIKNQLNVSPHKLYEMAKGDTEKYIELMKAHGYIIPKEQGIRSMEEFQRKYFPNLVGKECPYCGKKVINSESGQEKCEQPDKKSDIESCGYCGDTHLCEPKGSDPHKPSPSTCKHYAIGSDGMCCQCGLQIKEANWRHSIVSKEVEELANIICTQQIPHNGSRDWRKELASRCAKKIIDAGYRKVGG